MIRTLGAILAFVMIVNPASAISLNSPNGDIEAIIASDATATLYFRVVKRTRLVIPDSRMGITVDNINLGTNITTVYLAPPTKIDETYACRGERSSCRNYCNASTVTVNRTGSGDLKLEIELRVYDNGVAFRYRIPGTGNRRIRGESTSWKLPEGSVVWSQDNVVNYEGIINRRVAEELAGRIGPPLTLRLPDNGPYSDGYAMITEADLTGFSGMSFEVQKGTNILRTVFKDDPSGFTVPGGSFTPWRVITVSDDLNGLVNAQLVNHLAPPPSPELASADWIRPGRAVWSWWAHDTRLEDQVPYIDAAVQLGFEYTLWDEGWERWGDENLDKLLAYARDKGVNVWLWKRQSEVEAPAAQEAFWSLIDSKNKALGRRVIVGAKIDFFDSESQQKIALYRALLEGAARHNLMVNFHGANKPAGEARTWPNEMTREGIRGLEYNKFNGANPPWHNVGLLFTRCLAGASDYTPVTFDPKRIGETTFAHQLATAFLFTSPVIHFADDPRRYLEAPAPVVEMIKACPAVWDETIVQPGTEIGESAIYARRRGETWFVAGINGNAKEAKDVTLELRFLADGRKYRLDLVADDAASATAFSTTTRTAEKDARVPVSMRPGGGFVARLTPENQ